MALECSLLVSLILLNVDVASNADVEPVKESTAGLDLPFVKGDTLTRTSGAAN